MKQLRGIQSALQSLNDNWNPAYWIWAGAGTLYLMRYDKNGKTAMLPDGGVDSDYIIETYEKIDIDGGDW